MTPERERRPMLATIDPLVAQVLDGVGIDKADEAYWDAQRWGRAFIASRDAWASANRHGRRYSDREAPLSRAVPRG